MCKVLHGLSEKFLANNKIMKYVLFFNINFIYSSIHLFECFPNNSVPSLKCVSGRSATSNDEVIAIASLFDVKCF